MALPWLAALKVIPWGDVIEHAPQVLAAARKLLERQRGPKQPLTPHEAVIPAALGEPPSPAALHQLLMTVQQQIDNQALAQEQLAQTLAELAEQNTRLVDTVELLRLRTRMLMAAVVVMVLAGLLSWALR